MEDIVEAIAALQAKGWTISAISNELEIPRNTVDRWKRGVAQPIHSKIVLLALRGLLPRKRVPKGKRYTATRLTRTPPLSVGDKVQIVAHPTHDGKQGEVILITEGVVPTSQAIPEIGKIGEFQSGPRYIVQLDDGMELHYIRGHQLLRL